MSLITIIAVSISYVKTAKGGYNAAEVTYKDDRGQTKAKKIMDFANPAVYKIMEKATQGECYEITTRKNDKDFIEWSSAVLSDGSGGSDADAPSPTRAVVASTPSKAPTSNYETREERSARQRLIVRQSSLGHAVEVLTTGAKAPPSIEEVEALADRFTAFVYQSPSVFETPNDLEQ